MKWKWEHEEYGIHDFHGFEMTGVFTLLWVFFCFGCGAESRRKQNTRESVCWTDTTTIRQQAQITVAKMGVNVKRSQLNVMAEPD
jgi:hypothetical protein